MAYTRQKSKNTWQIEVSNGTDASGKRITETFSITRPPGLNDKEWQKNLTAQEADFELKVKGGRILKGRKVSFLTISQLWIDDCKTHLAPKTIFEYERYLIRINNVLGQYKITEIKPHHIKQLYKIMQDPMSRGGILYQPTKEFMDFLKDQKYTPKILSERAKINKKTASKILNGSPTNMAVEICKRLDIPLVSSFEILPPKPLSGRTLNHYHWAISSVFEFAADEEYIKDNPIRQMKSPVVEPINQRYFHSMNELKLVRDQLKHEHIKHKAWIYVALGTGCRLGELGGLRWVDLNMENNNLKIMQALQSLSGAGIFLKDPKNSKSKREFNVPDITVQVLLEYKTWQDELRSVMGDKWHETGLIFTQNNGKAMYPSSPSQWFSKWRGKHKLPNVNFHGLRHTHVSMLLEDGISVQSVSGRIGHARTETTQREYSHFLLDSDKKSGDAINKRFEKLNED